jgi:hypothetical protein
MTILMVAALPLGSGACLDHRAAPNCDYRPPPGSKEPGEPCGEDEECVPGSICFEGTCVGDGSLRVSLGWDVVSDFDLHLTTPDGGEIYYADPTHQGGQLDVDDCVLTCKDPFGIHVENIFFGDDAPIGNYQVWVENFNGRKSGDFFIEVEGEGIYEYWEGSLPASSGATSPIYPFFFDPPPPPMGTESTSG